MKPGLDTFIFVFLAALWAETDKLAIDHAEVEATRPSIMAHRAALS